MAERSTTKTRIGFNGQFTHCVNQESRHSSYSSSLQQPHAGDATVGNFHFITKKKKKKTVFESTVCFLCTIKNIKLNFKSSYQKDEKGQSRSVGWGGRGGRTTSTTVGGGRGGKEGRTGPVVESKNREAAKRFEAEETESDSALLLLLSPRFCATQFILDFKSFCCFTPKHKKQKNSRILKILKGARTPPPAQKKKQKNKTKPQPTLLCLIPAHVLLKHYRHTG